MQYNKWRRRILVLTATAFTIALGFEPASTYFVDRLNPVDFSRADLFPGGSYTPEEKSALFAGCLSKYAHERQAACQCFTEKAGARLARVERQSLLSQWSWQILEAMRIAKGMALAANRSYELPGPYLLAVMRQDSNKLAASCGLSAIY